VIIRLGIGPALESSFKFIGFGRVSMVIGTSFVPVGVFLSPIDSPYSTEVEILDNVIMGFI
jgi:hypothetical protein